MCNITSYINLHFKFSRLIIVLVLSLSINSVELFAAEWNLLKEVDGEKVKLKVNNKSRSYWILEKQDTISVKVIGPASLKAYCRAALSSKRPEVLFGLLSIMDGNDRKLVGDGASQDKSVRYPKLSKQRISYARSFIYDIPSGEHEMLFIVPHEVKKSLYLRFLVSSNVEDERSWIAYLPRGFQDEVRLVIKEREYIYYRSDSSNPIELEVIGPTRIRGVARLEFDPTIRGDKSFRIQVKENDKVLSTQPITARVSAVAKYPNASVKIPARGENFYFDVPSGKHLLEIHTPDIGISILLRFYIPQKDLGNEQSTGQNGRAGATNFGN
jgi:hypothetical protein